MATKKVIGYQITNAKQDIPNGLYSFQVFKTAEQAFNYLREHKLNKGLPAPQCWFVKEYYEGDIEYPTYIREKKRYNVVFYYHTNLTISVEAESEEEALALAQFESEKSCYTQDLLNGLQEDCKKIVIQT